ncbi:FAD/NAD(P)-binding domain-containing protein [Wolfiporia cocos MD-104 SS10]|uniref:FAD/NAD(P)-binding domain-containing protein n=1 Tax=Wolfiporia cocos (strain MD-104) TaxID=742152 RepID=A0A2H3JYS1_WOLCO|nr:FAD/NAD(P)-binding domain-containing protein [Wolfiporia cocos MD-104 SS10]
MEPESIVSDWLARFGVAAFNGDIHGLLDTILPFGWLRDALIFTWDTRALEGHERIAVYLQDRLARTHLANFKVDERPGLRPERVRLGTLDGDGSDTEASGVGEGVTAGFSFDTPDRTGRGFVYLLQEKDTNVWKALSVFLNLEEIKGHEEAGAEAGVYGGHTIAWEEVYAERRAETERNPHVVVVGGGQTGLQIAARFKQMNIPTVVVERHKTIGDQWRQRYPTLSLHTIRNHHTFLYQPYPRNWPLYTPRDKVADWLKQYAESQDLVVWTSSHLEPTPTYDRDTKRWTVAVNRAGSLVTVHPAHIVIAIGTLGAPRIPDIAGRDRFRGTIMHASTYMGGHPFKGKNAIVVGAGNTSADICQDLVVRGASTVTMVQRSSTCVVSIKNVREGMFHAYPDGMPLEIADLKFNAMPMNLQRRFARKREPEMWARESDLHAKLRKGGVKLNMGRDGSGQHFLIYERVGGFWTDVGVADMIESGQVKIKQGKELVHFEENTVTFSDGSQLPADLVVFATGYLDPRVSLKELFGAEVVDNAGPLWGFDEEGEITGCYRPTGHPGFWYGAGDFSMSRFMSKQLALQIKAIELGIISQE